MIYISKFPQRDLNDILLNRVSITPIMNILINDRQNNWYCELGKYYYEKNNNQLDGNLSYFNDKMNFSFFDRLKKKDVKMYEMIASFITTDIDRKLLCKMFGDPIFHDEFGEGFREKEIKHQFASHFIRINKKMFHIGYDHRGTIIECESSISAEELFKDLKLLMNAMIKTK